MKKPHGLKGRASPLRGTGKVVAWLREHVSHIGLNCLPYPFAVNKQTNYGQFGLDGQILYAHRFMCELKNGPAPSDDHEAAHNCGNAHMKCINPNHLEWKTRPQNAQDRKRHGNYQDQVGTRRWRLTPEQVQTVKDLKGHVTQWELAQRFGVSRQTISGIHTGVLYTSGRNERIWERRNRNVLI
jgi:HNH endonuclease